jgi:DNA-binding NarL/FixJ family response regulator
VLIQVDFAECDGCGLRMPATEMPDIWIQIQQNGEPTRMYCSAACHAEGDGASLESRVAARAARFNLSPIDVGLLDLLAEGLSNSELAFSTGVAESTIKNRCTELFQKLDVFNRQQAVLVAGHLQIVDLASHGARIRRSSRV